MSLSRLTKKIRKPHRRQPINNQQENQMDMDSLSLFDTSDESQLEIMTSCLANLQVNIEESRFFEIISGEVIKKLIDCLKHPNPQIVVNSLYAFQNLFRISSCFEDRQFETMSLNLNLVSALESLQADVCSALQIIQSNENLPHVICGLLTLMTEFFETCQQTTLKRLETSSLFTGTLNLIVQVLQRPISQEVYIQLFNYLQILSESFPKVNDLVAQSQSLLGKLIQIFQGDFANNGVLDHTSFPYRQKLRSLLIIVIFNIIVSTSKQNQKNNENLNQLQQTFRNSVGELITNVLTVNIFKEVENLKSLITSGVFFPTQQVQAQVQEEDIEEIENPKKQPQEPSVDLDEDKKIKNALSIWLDTADAIMEQLKFIARIYEGTDYQDEIGDADIEEEFDQDSKAPQQRDRDELLCQLFPAFFEPIFQQEVFTLLFKNFYSLEVLINQQDFLKKVQGYKLCHYIKEASLMIVNQALSAIQNIADFKGFKINTSVLQSFLEGIHRQVETILNTHSILYEDREDLSDLLNGYLKCYVLLLQKDQQLLQDLPETVLIKIAQLIFSHKGLSEEPQLNFIELLKQKYSSKIKNSLQTILQLTELLLQVISSSEPLVAAQALDCLFDVYTEEDYNQILSQKNILQVLQQGHDYMKDQIGTYRNKMRPEDLKFMKVTLVNLKHFIAYKKKIMGVK